MANPIWTGRLFGKFKVERLFIVYSGITKPPASIRLCKRNDMGMNNDPVGYILVSRSFSGNLQKYEDV